MNAMTKMLRTANFPGQHPHRGNLASCTLPVVSFGIKGSLVQWGCSRLVLTVWRVAVVMSDSQCPHQIKLAGVQRRRADGRSLSAGT